MLQAHVVAQLMGQNGVRRTHIDHAEGKLRKGRSQLRHQRGDAAHLKPDEQADEVGGVAVADFVQLVQEAVSHLRQAANVLQGGVLVVDFRCAHQPQALSDAAGGVGVIGDGHCKVHLGLHSPQPADQSARRRRPEDQQVDLRHAGLLLRRCLGCFGALLERRNPGLGQGRRGRCVHPLNAVQAAPLGADSVVGPGRPNRTGQQIAAHRQHHPAARRIGNPPGQRVARPGGRPMLKDHRPGRSARKIQLQGRFAAQFDQPPSLLEPRPFNLHQPPRHA